MPYNTREAGERLARPIIAMTPGELNYLFTVAAISCDHGTLRAALMEIAQNYLAADMLSYGRINDVIGALVCAQFEYTRRMQTTRHTTDFESVICDLYLSTAVPYQRVEIATHGDVYPEGTPT
jgi:hypothetical protein